MAQSCDTVSVQLGRIKSMKNTASDKIRAVRENIVALQNEEHQLAREIDAIQNLCQEVKELEQYEQEND
eukprot:5680954-Pyramimonas_sp.AAC.1